MAGDDTATPGKLIPLCSPSGPPSSTRAVTSPSWVDSTLSLIRPSSSRARTRSSSSPSVAGPSVATSLARRTCSTGLALLLSRGRELSDAAEHLLGQLVERQLGPGTDQSGQLARRAPVGHRFAQEHVAARVGQRHLPAAGAALGVVIATRQ